MQPCQKWRSRGTGFANLRISGPVLCLFEPVRKRVRGSVEASRPRTYHSAELKSLTVVPSE